MQVMNELRKGVKLKKVQLLSWGQEGGRGQLAFELTPYEILMDDVRSKKYKLHKPSPEVPSNLSAILILPFTFLNNFFPFF